MVADEGSVAAAERDVTGIRMMAKCKNDPRLKDLKDHFHQNTRYALMRISWRSKQTLSPKAASARQLYLMAALVIRF